MWGKQQQSRAAQTHDIPREWVRSRHHVLCATRSQRTIADCYQSPIALFCIRRRFLWNLRFLDGSDKGDFENFGPSDESDGRSFRLAEFSDNLDKRIFFGFCIWYPIRTTPHKAVVSEAFSFFQYGVTQKSTSVIRFLKNWPPTKAIKLFYTWMNRE